MDWEQLTGREGAALDGFIPDEDDPPRSFSSDTHEEESAKEFLDRIEFNDWAELYTDDILEKMGIFPKDDYDEEYDEKRAEITTEIKELFEKGATDLSNDNEIRRAEGKLEEYFFLENELEKRDFEDIIKKCIEHSEEMHDIYTIEDVLGECGSRSFVRHNYVYPVMLGTMISEHEQHPQNATSVLENEIRGYLATKIDALNSPEIIEEAIEKLENYCVFEKLSKALFRLKLQKELKKSPVKKSKTLNDIIDLCYQSRHSSLDKYISYLSGLLSSSHMSALYSFLKEDEICDVVSLITEQPLHGMTESGAQDLMEDISRYCLLNLACKYDNDRVDEVKTAFETKIEYYLKNPGKVEDKTVGDVIDDAMNEVFSVGK